MVKCKNCGEKWGKKSLGYAEAKKKLDDTNYEECPACEELNPNYLN